MRAFAAVTLTLAAALPATAQPVTYSLLNLGGGVNPLAINASGQTAGYVDGNTAFRASAGGQVTLLGAGRGLAINDAGQVAGIGGTGNGVLTTATGDYSTATDLGPIGGTSTARAVNDVGQVTGSALLPGNSVNHAMRTTPGGVFDATADVNDINGIGSSGYAINASGQVTGSLFTAGSSLVGQAFRTTATGTLSTADDLGTLGGGTFSRGLAINASGQVAGYSLLPGNQAEHAFRSSADGQPVSIQDLGTLGGTNSSANGINALGVVVGQADTTSGSVGFAYDTSMHNLNAFVPAGWNITDAFAINDAGQIAAEGSFQGGPTDGLILTPIPVPEPSALALTGAAGICFALRRLWRRK